MATRTQQPFEIEFDPGTIKHLGIQMYSTLPPVIGELVANAWDADASRVEVTIPEGQFSAESEIVISDDGCGMADSDVRAGYLIVGWNRRKANGEKTPKGRPVMGRKGIGKFSGFGIAAEIEVETVKDGETSRFVMKYADFERASDRRLRMPALPPTGQVQKGTRVTLRRITKFRNRSVPIAQLRRGLARHFAIIGGTHGFEVRINAKPITAQERDLQRLLDTDAEGKKYLWSYTDEEIEPGTGWTVSGWIGALRRTDPVEDGIQRGIAILARGKLVQAPFVFDAVVGQQFALSYLVGELHAEFVDASEDTIATARNSLVWDAEPNMAFKEWGRQQVNRIAREWAERRAADNERELAENPAYKRFLRATQEFEDRRAKAVADKLIRAAIRSNPLATPKQHEPLIDHFVAYLEFDAFKDLADELTKIDAKDVPKVVELFREWEVVEAKEMLKVTEGRIKTIEKLEHLINTDALEVPALHNFLKEFPWVLDPRWTLVADELTYTELLRKEFPETDDVPDEERRIDFLCVRESATLVVVEIKRPSCKASKKQLEQIEDYVSFMRAHVKKTSDPELTAEHVVGYLLVGDVVNKPVVTERVKNLQSASIFVRTYADLLRLVRQTHRDFLDRYRRLKEAKRRSQRASG